MDFGKFQLKSYSDLEEIVINNKLKIEVSSTTTAMGRGVVLGGFTVPNSIAIHPMEGCDATLDGSPDKLTLRRYKRFADSKAGLIWFEAIAVTEDGKCAPRQLHIRKDNVSQFKDMVDMVISTQNQLFNQTPLCIAQLTHSGRFSRPHGVSEPIYADKNPHFEERFPACKTTEPVTDEYLSSLVDRFVEAAILCKQAGFHGVDIKACHKYLLSELLGSHTREGKYGGSFENRTRLMMDIIKEVRKAVGDEFIIASRFNIYDGIPYPYSFGTDKDDVNKPDFAEPIKLLNMMAEYGVHLIDISMGSPYYKPSVNRPFDRGGYTPNEHPIKGIERLIEGASIIQKGVKNIAVVGTGYSWLRQFAPYVASGTLERGWATFIGFGRQAFADPSYIKDVLENGEVAKQKCCVTCSMCSDLLRAGEYSGCVPKDSEVYLPIYREKVQK